MASDVPVNRVTTTNLGSRLAQKLDTAGWGLFFIWVGIALLTDISWGFGLLGVAVILIGGQVARKCFGLAVHGLWLVCGLLFLVGGLWETWQVELSLVPILLIVAGGALLASLAFRPRR